MQMESDTACRMQRRALEQQLVDLVGGEVRGQEALVAVEHQSHCLLASHITYDIAIASQIDACTVQRGQDEDRIGIGIGSYMYTYTYPMESARTGERECVQMRRQRLRALEQIAQHVAHALRASNSRQTKK